MLAVQFFQQLQVSVCAYCGHDIELHDNNTYVDVCTDCLDVLDEE